MIEKASVFLESFIYTAQKIKFFFCKYDQIGRETRISSHLLKKSLMKNLIFCAVIKTRLE